MDLLQSDLSEENETFVANALQRILQSEEKAKLCYEVSRTANPNTIDGIEILILNQLVMFNMITGREYIETVWNFYEWGFNGEKILNKCEVRPATHGRGVFATKPIAPMEVITLYPGHYKTVRESDPQWRSIIIKEGQAIRTEEEYTRYEFNGKNIALIGDPDVTDDPTFLGHMCNDKAKSSCPEDESIYETISSKYCNSAAVPVGSHFYAVIAIKPIKVGEEICFSYGLPYWRKYGRI